MENNFLEIDKPTLGLWAGALVRLVSGLLHLITCIVQNEFELNIIR